MYISDGDYLADIDDNSSIALSELYRPSEIDIHYEGMKVAVYILMSTLSIVNVYRMYELSPKEENFKI